MERSVCSRRGSAGAERPTLWLPYSRGSTSAGLPGRTKPSRVGRQGLEALGVVQGQFHGLAACAFHGIGVIADFALPGLRGSQTFLGRAPRDADAGSVRASGDHGIQHRSIPSKPRGNQTCRKLRGRTVSPERISLARVRSWKSRETNLGMNKALRWTDQLGRSRAEGDGQKIKGDSV